MQSLTPETLSTVSLLLNGAALMYLIRNERRFTRLETMMHIVMVRLGFQADAKFPLPDSDN